MTDTVSTSTDLAPADARVLAAQWRESQRLATASVIPRSITHHRAKVNGTWQDVANDPAVVRATVFAVVRYGAEVFGLPGPAALARIDVIEGRLEPRYDALVGLMLDAGHQVRVREMTAERAEIAVRRAEDRSDPNGWQTFAFTVDEALDAGYVKAEPDERERRGAWYVRRADMLLSKAARRAFRLAGADALMQRQPVELIEGAPVVEYAAAEGAPPPPAELDDLASEARAEAGDEDVVDAEIVEGGTDAGPGGRPAASEDAPPSTPTDPPMTDPQSRALHSLLRSARGAVGPARHAVLSELLGRPIESASELTAAEASRLIETLQSETEHR